MPDRKNVVPHLLLIGARSEAIGKILGLPIALTVMRRQGGFPEFERSVTLRTVEADITDVDALLMVVREVDAWRRIDAVLGMTELSLYPSSMVGEALRVRVNPSAAAALARDKSSMRRRLAEHGLDTTAHRVCASVEEAEDFASTCPNGVILKPVDGNGGTGVSLARQPSEIATAWAFTSSASGEWITPGTDGNTVLAEEYLTGQEFSVETISAYGKHRVLTVTIKHTSGPPHFVEIGHDLPAPLPLAEYSMVADAACNALNAIGHLWGPCHTEIMLGGDKAIVVEINTRSGGDRIWEMVELTTGINMPVAAAVALAFGELQPATEIARGAAAIRFLTATPGRIISVTGLDDARAVDGVFRVGEVREPGHLVPVLSDSWGRVGYVLAGGADVVAAAAAAEAAVSRIVIKTEADE